MKLIFCAIFTFAGLLCLGQTSIDSIPKPDYIVVVAKSNAWGTKLKFTVDFGQKYNGWNKYYKQQLIDEEGEGVEFNSVADALNFFSKHGFVFEQSMFMGLVNAPEYHYIMRYVGEQKVLKTE